ncbi:hypothetical protein JCGZ_26555 [Jatropha curcas]|uniref:Uncharacterized protein n=1 Tax=Jatropha curcas TaxID=180498 RepID=A0A067LFV1_JATCU|nr:hypothetical protein JCGZ_26555 [Jatropha curcas]
MILNFFEEIDRDSGKFVYCLNDTMHAFEIGAIKDNSQKGSQFCQGFGGISGILRYQLDVGLLRYLVELNWDHVEQLALQYMKDLDRCKPKKKGHDHAISSTPVPAFGNPGRETRPSLRSTDTLVSISNPLVLASRSLEHACAMYSLPVPVGPATILT